MTDILNLLDGEEGTPNTDAPSETPEGEDKEEA